MKVKKFILTVFVASVTFVSCDSGSEGEITTDPVGNGMKSVTVTIANQKNADPKSRAVANGGLTEDNTTVAETNNLCALFANEAGMIIKVINLSEVGNDTDSESEGNVYTFHKLSKNVTKVAFTNTTNTKITENVNTLADAKNAQNDLTVQNVSGALDKILVYGESDPFIRIGDDKHDDGATYEYYTAGEVTVNPAVARLEITNFQCTDLSGTTAYENGLLPRYKYVKISAVGINNTYFNTIGTSFVTDWSTITPEDDGTQRSGDLFNYNTAEEVWLAQTNWTRTAFAETEYITLAGKDTKSTKVIAFNVAPGNVPQIIVQVAAGEQNENITGTVNLHFPYYVKTKMDGGLSGADLTGGFKAGSIYQVDFAFPCEKVQPWTPSDDICVNVTVNIPKWTIVKSLKPEFD